MYNEAQTLEIVLWLEAELETARRQLRDLRLSQDTPLNNKNPCEAGPVAHKSLPAISRQGEELENASPVILRGNSRKLSKDRYERKIGSLLLAVNLATEFQRVIVEGRIPWNVALLAVGVVTDEIETKFAEESLSWCEDLTPTYANYRGRMEAEDE